MRRAVTVWGDRYSTAAGIPWVEHPADELERTVELAASGRLTVRIARILPCRVGGVAGHYDTRIGNAFGRSDTVTGDSPR